MKTLMLSIYFPPEIGANSRIVGGLSEELHCLGDSITVLTAMPHYPEGIIKKEYRGKYLVKENRNGISIIRTWLLVAPRERAILRIANNLFFAITCIIGSILSRKQDILYTYSPPIFLGFSAYVISRLKRIPFIINVQDIYPEIAVNYGIVRNKKIIKILEAFEKWVYQKANHISVISNGFKKNLLNKHIKSEKISVVPNWVEIDMFQPRSKQNSFSEEFGINRSFVVMYAGNIGYSQGLETLVEAANLLKEQKEIQFVIIGDGVKKESLMNLIKSYHLKNVIVVPFQPRIRMPDVLASADVCLVILRPNKSKTTIQSKTYEIMAMKRPIIAAVDFDGDNWKLIDEAKAGIWVKPGSPDGVKKAILELYHDAVLRDNLGKNGRQYVLKNNSREIVASRYREILLKEINGGQY